MIGPISWGSQSGSEETIEAQINPRGQETAWKISSGCPGHPACQHAEGDLPAESEGERVSALFTGLEPGVPYTFTVAASNASGGEVRSSEFTVQPIPPGACPEGCGEETPYHPPELPWANESGREAAARAVQEQREKEQEAAAKTAAEEAARREEAARQAAAYLQAHRCVVPALKGDTLASARRALSAAHCGVGSIHGPAHRHGALRVIRQGTRPGKRLANDAHVTLWVAIRQSARRPR